MDGRASNTALPAAESNPEGAPAGGISAVHKSMKCMNNQSNLNSFPIIFYRSATYCAISEETPAALSRTPKGRRQAGSRHPHNNQHPKRFYTNKSSAIAAPCKKTPPSQTKNFPREHPHHTKRNKFSPYKGGCSWGKFGVGQGGLEGRETPPKGVSLRLQGLPYLSSEIFL